MIIMWLARKLFSTTVWRPPQSSTHNVSLSSLSPHTSWLLGLHLGGVQCSTLASLSPCAQLVQRSSFHARLSMYVQCAVLEAQRRRWPEMLCRTPGYFPVQSLAFTLSCSHIPLYNQGGKQVTSFFALWSAVLSQALQKNKLEDYEILCFLNIAMLILVLLL